MGLPSYSMFQEDVAVLRHLGHKGRLIDIGAGDGIEHSNSRLLLKNGWSGLLFEPNPSAYARLCINTDGLEARCEHYAVGPAPSAQHPFYVDISTPAYSNALGPIGDRLTEQTYVRMVGIEELLTGIGVPVDLISIDAEGMDTAIVSALITSGSPRPRSILIEVRNEAELADQASILGTEYRRLWYFSADGESLPGNSFWVKR